MSDDPEDLKEKIRAILVELEDESLKYEVLQELKAAKRGVGFLQHPAFLLALGFFLTGVVGTLLTSAWQNMQQHRQQEQVAREREIQKKYEVADQINKDVAEAYAGTQVMLHNLFYGREGTEKEMLEREAYWKQTRRTWIINSLILEQKLAITFKHNEDFLLYQKIVNEGESMGINIDQAVKILKQSNWRAIDNKDVVSMRKTALQQADNIRENTKELLKHLIEDIHLQENSQERNWLLPFF